MGLTEVLKRQKREFKPHFQPGFLQRDTCVFQFRFKEDSPFYLDIVGEDFDFHAGVHENATITLDISDHETCWGLLDGRIDGMKAFMEGDFRADGNIVLITRPSPTRCNTKSRTAPYLIDVNHRRIADVGRRC